MEKETLLEEEIKYVSDMISVLEWSERKVPGINIPVLYSSFMPVVSNRQHVVGPKHFEKTFNKKDIVTFRPILNGRHMQYIIDYLYEEDESIDSIVTSRDPIKKKYNGYILLNDGTKYTMEGMYTETQLKFALCYLYMFDKNISDDINKISKHAIQFRK